MTPILAVAAADLADAFSPTAIVVGVVLLVLNGYFVAVEIALLAVRRTLVEDAAEAGDKRAQRALKALRELSVTFSGAQLGITVCSLGLGAVAEPAVASLIAQALDGTVVPAGLVPVVAIVLAMSLVVFLHMVMGEMAPKNLALARAESVALALARSFGWFATLFRPLILALNAMANGLLLLVRVKPVAEHKVVHNPEELALVLAESRDLGTILAQDARVLDAALSLASIDAAAAMTPRVDLAVVEDVASVDELLEVARATGHTRIPVYHGAIDHIVGLVNIKDVLVQGDSGPAVADVLRPIAAVPESRDLESLLRDMLDERSHAVLVVDEFGGTAGLVTLEDVLEELVGDIVDEFDVGGDAGAPPDERRWVVAGTLRRDELERLTRAVLDGGEAETVSGWMVERLGRLLEVGDTVETGAGWRLTVQTLEGRRAGDIEVLAPAPDDAS